jgi:hypothetical protein
VGIVGVKYKAMFVSKKTSGRDSQKKSSNQP